MVVYLKGNVLRAEGGFGFGVFVDEGLGGLLAFLGLDEGGGESKEGDR